MCGRFVQYSDPEIYASQFDLDTLCQTTPRYNVAPTQPVLGIRGTEEGKRALVPLRWGIVPAWSKGPDSRYSDRCHTSLLAVSALKHNTRTRRVRR